MHRANVLAVLMLSLLLMVTAGTARAQGATQVDAEAVGSVVSVRGTATITRNAVPTAPKAGDSVFKGDVIETGSSAALAITFDDESTLQLQANVRLVVDEFVYEEGGSKNSALFKIARGAVAFVAQAIAKSGDMKIETPTAVLGIRGTTGLVDVPEGRETSGSAREVTFKLYPDADGRVGRMEVFAPGGATRLGVLTQGTTGFAMRRGAAGQFAAVPLRISALEAARDRAIVRQVFSSHSVGRQMVRERRNLRQPGLPRSPQRQPNLQRRPGSPGRIEPPKQPAGRQPGPQEHHAQHQPLPQEPGKPKQQTQPRQQRPAPHFGPAQKSTRPTSPVRRKRKP